MKLRTKAVCREVWNEIGQGSDSLKEYEKVEFEPSPLRKEKLST